MKLSPCFLAAALFLSGVSAHSAELRGHGGPVRAIAVTADGKSVITGSFDGRAIVWSLDTSAARAVLHFHDSEVNAVAVLPNGGFATAGADGRIAIWETDNAAPARILEGHTGPVAALAVSPDGTFLASASWDTHVRVWPLSGGPSRVLKSHSGNVNAVAFLADGTLVSAGYDANLIFWPQTPEAATVTMALPTPLSTLVALPDDRLAVGGTDGRVRVLDRSGPIQSREQIASTPVTALAASPDGQFLAATGPDGAIRVLDATSLAPVRMSAGTGQPVWSLAFATDGKSLWADGADGVVRQWDIASGEYFDATVTGSSDALAEFEENPDAEAFRACIACHTLGPTEATRAGPTLHGIFGRKIASVPGYRYSKALRNMDIIWTPETVSKLFEVGPNTYTPGTKMPEQTIRDPEDRAALIRFLQSATRAD